MKTIPGKDMEPIEQGGIQVGGGVKTIPGKDMEPIEQGGGGVQARGGGGEDHTR